MKVIILLLASTILSACTLFDKHSYSGLQVDTNSVPSNIFINDTHIGKSPLVEHKLKPGIYSIKIIPDNQSYVPYETTITLREGVLNIVTWRPSTKPELSGGVIYELEPLRSKTTEVSFVTIPDNAIVNFGGREKEFSPYVFTDVKPGYTEYEVTLPSYETQKHTADILQGYRMHVTVKLAKLRSAEDELTNEGILDATPSGELANTNNSTTSAEDNSGNPPQEQLPVVNTTPATASRSGLQNSGSLNPPPGNTNGNVKIKPTGYFENDEEVLRVRKDPPYGQTLGFVKVGTNLPYLGENNNNWLKVWFNNQDGWVSGQYAEIVE